MALVVKNLLTNLGDIRDWSSIPELGRPMEEGVASHSRKFLPGKSHRQRSLAGYSP